MPDHRQKPQESAERCVVCNEQIAKGEGRYRLNRGPVHVQCRGRLPEEER